MSSLPIATISNQKAQLFARRIGRIRLQSLTGTSTVSSFGCWDQIIASSDTRELHDACLVFRADLGQRLCTFTGDASDANLNWVAHNTTHICDDILHASHHGSINGADPDFIKACGAEYTVVSTESGVKENIPHATALKRYADGTKQKVYRTDVDGTLEWTF